MSLVGTFWSITHTWRLEASWVLETWSAHQRRQCEQMGRRANDADRALEWKDMFYIPNSISISSVTCPFVSMHLNSKFLFKVCLLFLWITTRVCLHKAFTSQRVKNLSACTCIATMTKKKQQQLNKNKRRRRQYKDTERDTVPEQIFIPNLLPSPVARPHNKGKKNTNKKLSN